MHGGLTKQQPLIKSAADTLSRLQKLLETQFDKESFEFELSINELNMCLIFGLV